MTGMRVYPGDEFRLIHSSSTTSPVDCVVEVDSSGGEELPHLFELQDAHAGDRSTEIVNFPVVVSEPGVITGARASITTAKRGQAYAGLFILRRSRSFRICQGYVYDGHAIHLGESVEPGPGGGEGFLSWVVAADDVSGNVVTTFPLAATNTLRLVRQVVLRYVANGVATRLVDLRLAAPGSTAGPTAFGITATVWGSPVLTLTDTQDGIIYVGKKQMLSVNDNGTLTYADHTTAPHPFPLWVEEDDTVDLVITSASGEAADDYDVYVQIEEWIKI